MKNINYFLEEEDKYCQTKPVDIEVWDEEVKDWNNRFIPMDFLRSRPFHRTHETITYIKERTEGYNLNDAELTVLGMFIMHCSGPFRDDYYENPIPEFARNMFEVLDSVVSKAPLTKHRTIYRFCVDEDRDDMNVGDVVTFPYNLTCTTTRWNRKNSNIYNIQTLSQEKTHAHDIFKMYSHNVRERQVNFLRGTQFYIFDIKKIAGTENWEFYMIEKEDIND